MFFNMNSAFLINSGLKTALKFPFSIESNDSFEGSVEKLFSTHADNPPLSTETFLCPITLNIHHTLALVYTPRLSYTTILLLLFIPSFRHSSEKASGWGIILGRSLSGSLNDFFKLKGRAPLI